MVDTIELQYATMLSNRLNRFKIKSSNPYKINFRCPICGDSEKSQVKARGWLLENPKSHSFHFFCHNCGGSLSFGAFLKTVDPFAYNDYLSEKYINKLKDKPVETKVEKKETIVHHEILSKIKKVSQLKSDHPVKQYIEKRKIPSSQHYRLYYAPKFMTWINSIIPNKFPNIKKDEPRLIIPLIDKNGKVFGVSGRSFDPNSLRYITIMFEEQPKIFGLDKVDFSKPYHVVEGPIDSLFLKNSVAMVGADGNTSSLEKLENAVYVFDNEPRNKEIHKRMEKIIKKGISICIWPSGLEQKDINDMILAGVTNVEEIITKNTYKGLEANLKLLAWKKT